jgi:hypothetical protein
VEQHDRGTRTLVVMGEQHEFETRRWRGGKLFSIHLGDVVDHWVEPFAGPLAQILGRLALVGRSGVDL